MLPETCSRAEAEELQAPPGGCPWYSESLPERSVILKEGFTLELTQMTLRFQI